MKQKLLLGALLLGALTLNSCVDDTESASVTAVRQAKAEQLKALGESEKIQAEAAKIQAEADAAYKNAMAEYQKALADAKNVQTEKDRVEAELAIKRAQAEIERIAEENELKILQLKYQIQQAQNNLQTAINNAAADKRNELTILFNEYRDASLKLSDDQSSLAGYKQTLSYYQADLISLQKAREQSIKWENDQIESYEEQIAEWEEEIATLEKYKDDAEGAKAALVAAQEELIGLNKTKELADNDKTIATDAQTEATNNFYNSVYVQNITSLRNFNWDNINYWTVSGFRVYVTEIPHRVNQLPTGNDEGKYGLFLYDASTDKDSYVVLFNGLNDKELTLNKEEGNVNNVVTYYEYNNPYALAENGAANLKKFLGNITATAEKNFTDAQKAYKDAVAAEATAKTKYETAKADQKAKADAKAAADKAVTDAQTAVDNAAAADKAAAQKKLDDAITAQTAAATALNKANTDLTNADNVYNNGYWDAEGNWVPSAKQQTQDALQAEVNAENALNSLTEKTDEILGYYDALAPQAKNFEGYTADLNAANLAEAKANLAYKVAETAWNQKNAEITGLTNVLAANNNVEGRNILDVIDNLQSNIKVYQGYIEDCKERIAEYEKITADETSKEEMIEAQKAAIAELEKKIEQDTIQLEIAKANLEAALNAQQPAE